VRGIPETRGGEAGLLPTPFVAITSTKYLRPLANWGMTHVVSVEVQVAIGAPPPAAANARAVKEVTGLPPLVVGGDQVTVRLLTPADS
jgi:hypothetical protein